MDKLLLIDDEDDVRYSFKRIFESPDLDLETAASGEEGLEVIKSFQPDLVLMDVRMGGITGLETLRRIRQDDAKLPVIMMTAFGTTQTAIEAMKLGAYDYLLKPFDVPKLKQIVADALKAARDMKQVVACEPLLESEDYDLGIVGRSQPMQEVFKMIGQLAGSDATALITGESGTGKELVARAIYQNSQRNDKSYLPINCAAIPESLLESELFGHEKGSFTGASSQRIGKFEQCDKGTLFLDEIGDIDETTQVKLLRFLGERTFERVGGNKTLTADVRVVAATNKNLKEMVGNGEFREDLYFRLNVVELWAPPLRERASDIPMLALSFLREFAEENAKPVSDFTVEALEAIIRYAWPGNVRELRTAVEHAVVLGRGDMIELAGLPQSVQSRGVIQHEKQLTQPLVDRGVTLEEAEKQLIIRTLKECRGNRTTAARKIGISRRTLHRKLNRYGLEGI